MSRGRGESERGSVAITVALSLTVLLGFAALVVDIGLNWATRTSAQTAADSAALAGASSLLSDGGVAAITTVESYLNQNVGGLVELPDDAGWATDGNVGNGEVVCWTMPDPVPVPVPGGTCTDDTNALQVTTPPIVVRYAFAPVLGKTTSSIRARAAAGAGPAAPNNCVLCVLEPDDGQALEVLGGGIRVTGGGIVVNSGAPDAVVLASAGDIEANQIRVVGGVDDTGIGELLPPAEEGGPPVPDPLADLPVPALPPLPNPARDITVDTTLTPGVYAGINVATGATLTLEEGVYVITNSLGFAGFTVRDRGVVSAGDGVTIYLTCDSYPRPCDNEDGARFQLDDGASFQLEDGGRFLASPPATAEYAGLSIFADRGNTSPMLLDGDLDLTGAIYAASAQLRVGPLSAVQVDSLVIVDRLLAANDALLRVSYDPSLPLIAIEPPVLIS
jgi:Putative Flp pilus-assembly TadE/G-like